MNHPFTAMVAGPTKAGKTVWVKTLVSHAELMIRPPPEKIYWCYTEWQPAYDELSRTGVVMVQGLPDMNELKLDKKPKLLILDDMMQEMNDNSKLDKLFTRGSHHWNISVLQIVQNLFYGKRTARINAQYLVLMKNPADQLQASTLAKQLYPGRAKFFMEAYQDACNQSYGYLFVDLSQDTSDNMRLKTDIFPGQTTITYVPKHC